MSAAAERRLLQFLCALAAFIPLTFGTMGVLRGAEWLARAHVTPDLDSHFRYLSGLFLMLGIGFGSCIRGIEGKGPRFRLLAAMVVMGGLARALSLAQVGPPSTGHLVGLGMELAVVPLLVLWQARVARRFT